MSDKKSDNFKGDIERLAELIANDTFSGIRCPICAWRPSARSRWCCADNAHPENFSGGCGTIWNTFETRGECPGCAHRWRWTSCLACRGWSLHGDWYEID